MGNISKFFHSEKDYSKQPGEPEEEHYTTDAEHHPQDGSGADFILLSSNSASFVPNQHYDDTDEDEEIKDHYGQDWCEKGAPEYFSMRDEAAVLKKNPLCLRYIYIVIHVQWTSLEDITAASRKTTILS